MVFKKLAACFSLIGLLAAGPNCNYGGVESTTKAATVRVEGTTERFNYGPGEKVKIKGPAKSNNSQMSFALNDKIDQSFEIKTRSRQFTPDGETLFSPEVLEQMESSQKERMHVMLQYNNSLTSSQRDELESRDIFIGHPVSPSNTYMASIPVAEGLESLLNPEGNTARFVGEIRPEDKLRPLLDKTADGTFKGFNVMFHPDISYREAVDTLSRAGARIENSFVSRDGMIKSFGVTTIWGDNQTLSEEIASLDEVYRVGQAAPLDELNFVGRALSGINFVHTNSKLTGAGELAVVYDGDYAKEHSDVKNRTINFDGKEHTGARHATHVNCTVIGDGSNSVPFLEEECSKTGQGPFEYICEKFNDPEVDRLLFENLFRGVAPGGTTISADHGSCDELCIIENPNDMYTIAITSASWGVVLMTASVGPNIRRNGDDCKWMIEYVYDSVAFTMDSIIRNEQIAVFVAAGNERSGHETNRRCFSDEFPVGEEYNSFSGGFASAKNTLAISAAALVEECEFIFDDNGNLVPGPDCVLRPSKYTSIGPMSRTNPRTKPDLMNFGGGGPYGVVSCSTYNDEYVPYNGTSMATPLTSGTALLVSQQYKNTLNTTLNPSPQLLYAILINSADDMKVGDNRYADYWTGHGYVDADGAIETAADKERFAEGVMTKEGETHAYLIDIQDDKTLEATLVWDDPSNEYLINNTRFRAISPSGEVYYPHVLDPANPAAEAIRQPDNYNNKKKIIIDMPEEKEQGEWKLEVIASTLTTVKEAYAVVFSHPAFAIRDAKVCNDREGPIRGRMGFTVEKCDKNFFICGNFADFNDGPIITLNEGKCYNFHNDFPGFSSKETGNYQITASFKQDGAVYENEDGSLAETYMKFIVKEE